MGERGHETLVNENVWCGKQLFISSKLDQCVNKHHNFSLKWDFNINIAGHGTDIQSLLVCYQFGISPCQ